MNASPWLTLGLASAAVATVAYLVRDDGEEETTSLGPETEPEPEPEPDPDDSDGEPPAQGPGEFSPGPLGEAPEPVGGWQSILTPQVAKDALQMVKPIVAAEAGATWKTAVRKALEKVFPNNTWSGLLGGWKDDARAYMIQRLDAPDIANRAAWPAGDDAKEAARVFWLKSSKAIEDCQGYNLQDISLATCICDLMFPGSNWPAAGTAGEPWEQKAWSMTLTKAGIV